MGGTARFFCDSCGSEVPRDKVRCPGCGRFFSSVKCPKCGFEGEAVLFPKGCPSCGYLRADRKAAGYRDLQTGGPLRIVLRILIVLFSLIMLVLLIILLRVI
ncbi:MAG TPA: hypothetical protein ENI27_03215 [bacterium]|nr:hypothetical protein [bacterium]